MHTVRSRRPPFVGPDAVAIAAVLSVLVWAAIAPPVWLTVVVAALALALLARHGLHLVRAAAPWWAGVLADGDRLRQITERADRSEADDLAAELWRARRLQRVSVRHARHLDRGWCLARLTGRLRTQPLASPHDDTRRALNMALDRVEHDLDERRRAVTIARAELDALDPTAS